MCNADGSQQGGGGKALLCQPEDPHPLPAAAAANIDPAEGVELNKFLSGNDAWLLNAKQVEVFPSFNVENNAGKNPSGVALRFHFPLGVGVILDSGVGRFPSATELKAVLLDRSVSPSSIIPVK